VLDAWLSDKHVARLVKRTVLATGLRPNLPDAERLALYSGHSLRAGLASHAEVPRSRGPDAPRVRLRRNDPQIPAPTRPLQAQPDEGRRAVARTRGRKPAGTIRSSNPRHSLRYTCSVDL
jgi:hypothetical protein